ncbi:MAG: hypothetical protein PHE77_01880 [Candidatus Pacebacteria bacterium]|nr:hypothetical protein [Candidatus Paceibacterota bacterium]
MERIIFAFAVLSAFFCFLGALFCFYLFDKRIASKTKKAGYFICAILLLVPVFSIFQDGNIYLLIARSVISFVFGAALLFDAILYRIAAKWAIAIEIVLALMVLMPAIETILKLAIIRFAIG